jgi:non-homologous end joining protein Ku
VAINLECHKLSNRGKAMAAMAARAIWKGSISFGLVNIPIQVFSATQKEEYTSFNQLCDKGNRQQQL